MKNEITARNALHYATAALVADGCKVIRVQPRILEAPDGSQFRIVIVREDVRVPYGQK